MNRLSSYFEESPGALGDYYVVAGEFGVACVSTQTARYIESVLDRRWVPAWVVFRDRVGSRIRVRTRSIRSIVESTAAQRAGDRRLDRARRHEEENDGRQWE
jgi:hypothetical protein